MALVGAERSAWKSQRATANAWAQSRGALLILNLLLYFICPVSAVAALPRDHFRDPPYSNSTIVHLSKWHTRFIANSSFGTWGSTFASGSHLMTMFPVDTAQGRPSSSQFQGFILASHRPHNVTTLPSSANVTYRRDSTTSISTSSGRHLKSSDQQAATTSHSTNISANVTHRRNSTTSLSPSPRRYLKFGNQEATKTRYYTNIPSRSIRLSNNSTQANYGHSSSHYSVSNIPRPSSLSRNTTRANYDITTAGVSLAKTSSISPGISSFTLPSSSPPRSHPSMTPLHTSSSPKPSGPSSFSSTTRATLPPASSSVASSQSSLASILPKALTPTPSVTSGPSLSTNEHPFSLPPGCKLTAFGNETYIIIPTERARKVHQPSPSTIPQAGADGYGHGPSPSTTSQAGADGYDQIAKDPFQQDHPPLDQELIDHSPSSQTSTVILATVLGVVPTCFAFPYAWYKFRKWRLEKNKKEKKTREGPEDPAEEAQDMYKTVKKGKWTERLASWLKDVEEFNPKATKVTPIWPTGAQRLIQMIQVSLNVRKLL